MADSIRLTGIAFMREETTNKVAISKEDFIFGSSYFEWTGSWLLIDALGVDIQEGMSV